MPGSCTMPNGSRRHAPESVFIRCQNPLRLDDINEPEPDIAILRPRADFYMTAHPGSADAGVSPTERRHVFPRHECRAARAALVRRSGR